MQNKNSNIIWITGASSGIGHELAKAYAKKGALLVLSARSISKLEEVRRSLKNPENHLVLPLDLMDASNFAEKVAQVISHYG